MLSDYEIFLKRKSEDEELLALIQGLGSEDERDETREALPGGETMRDIEHQEPILVPMKPISGPSRGLLSREDSETSLPMLEDENNESMKKYDPEGTEWIEDFLSTFNKV